MNGFNRSYMYRSTETEKKGRKTRNHKEQGCKCLPFVRVHYHDCPVVTKPCPIHGNSLHHPELKRKEDREQNVIISFHPSSKTERLLQPIKTLLAQCNSDTKINFQYYSPDNAHSKESINGQNNQSTYENLKRSFNNSIFVEKTKSFVASKRNKVKKLKNCFHSPCNSVTQKTRSQTSIKEKINQIIREEAKHTQNAFYNIVPDNEKYDPTSKWFASSKRSFSHDMLSDEKLDSDFITVTQREKNNAIHHKIFEIKHRKGMNDVPFVGFPKPATQLVYSTVNVTGGQTTKYSYERNERTGYRKCGREGCPEVEKNLEVNSSEKTDSLDSSSSGSVYITPFIFVPQGKDESDNDRKSKIIQKDFADEAVQVDNLPISRGEGDPKGTQTSPTQSTKIMPPILAPKVSRDEKNKVCRSITLQTDSFLCKEKICQSSKNVYVDNYEPQSTSRVEEIEDERAIMTRNFDENNYNQNKSPQMSRRGRPSTRSTEMQTCSDHPLTEVVLSNRWDGQMKDQTSQTDDLWKFQVSVRTFESVQTKSQATMPDSTDPQVSDKQIQTPNHPNTPVDTEFIHLNSPNVTYVIKPFEQQESDPAIDKLAKIWWGKSHSDSNLCERIRCGCCKGDSENQALPSEFSKQSNNLAVKSNCTGVYESGPLTTRMESSSKAVTFRTGETVERFSDTKRTSTREELCAAVSDLSELKKIIQEFFEKGSLHSKKSCECNRTTIKGTKTDNETMTDRTILPVFDNKTVQTSSQLIPKPVKQPLQAQGTQTSQLVDKKNATTSTGDMNKIQKKEAEVQTNAQEPLTDTEDRKTDGQRVKLHRTVIVDQESRTNTFFLCPLCGREIKNSTNAETNTDPHRSPERQQKPVSAGKEYIPSSEEKTPTKKVPISNMSDFSKLYDSNSEQTNNSNKSTPKIVKQQEDQPRNINSQNSRIPVPQCSKNNETVTQKDTILMPDWARKKDTVGSHCICDVPENPSSSRGQKRNPTQDPTNNPKTKEERPQPKSATGTCEPRRERPDAQNSRTSDNQKNENKSQRKNCYPIIFTPIWPKDFLKTWKSMENSVTDIPSSDDSNSQIMKQKSSEKYLDGKKIKVDGEQSSKEYIPELADIFRHSQLGDLKILARGFMTCKRNSREDEGNSAATDEQIPHKSTPLLCENSPENYDDILLERELFSECNNTPDTTENSSFEDEEEGGDAAILEIGEHFIPMTVPKLKPQSYSAVTFNKSLYSDAMISSKSLNTFCIFVDGKKRNRLHRKQSK